MNQYDNAAISTEDILTINRYLSTHLLTQSKTSNINKGGNIMSDGNVQRSEVARLLNQMREEYEAARRGLSGLAQGTSRHCFITARMENMGKLHSQLDALVGDEAIALVVHCLESCSDTSTPQYAIGEI